MQSSARFPVVSDPEYQPLLAQIKGPLVWPGQPDYDEARRALQGGIDRYPALVVKALDAMDVQQVVNLARLSGLELAVRSGGHSAAAHSTTEGGILLDLCNLRDMHIDPQAQTLWAGPGLTAGEVVNALAGHGLALPLGDTATVGLGGITLGGGIGYLVRKFGLTIDDLLAAELVTAEGECLQVDPNNHPDLFWAIRGGGGNFGVITHFLFRVHPLEHVYGGMLVLPATPESLSGFIKVAQHAPDEVSTIANVMIAPPMPFLPQKAHGELIIMAMMMYSGDPRDGEAAFAPFRQLVDPHPPLADMLRPMRYPEIYPPEEAASQSGPPCISMRTLFLDSLDEQTAALVVGGLRISTGALMTIAQFRVLGGAMSRVPVEATAFAHRNSRIMAQILALYPDPAAAHVHETWVSDLAAALQQGDPGRYVNFLGPSAESEVRAAYPNGAWERLQSIKSRYDPSNLFRLNQNIPPK